MLGKASIVLRIELGDTWYECRDTAEFDALLRSRVTPSGACLAELLALGDRGLFAARVLCLDRETHLEELAGAWMLGEDGVLAARDVTADQGWDRILSAVAAQSRGAEPFRFVAVERYRQYLRALLQCLDSIARGRLEERGDDSSVGRLATLGARVESSPQRLLLDLDALVGEHTQARPMERLPRGRPVTVRFGPHQSLPLRLARSDFLLVSGSTFLLIDDTGADVRLPARHTVIGRGSTCSVVLDARYRAVSRRHLQIEVDDDGTVHLTDTSSMGTFMPGPLPDG